MHQENTVRKISCRTLQRQSDLYLHHQDDGVERDQSHDAVLEGRRHHELPHAVLEAQFIFWHVASQRLGVDGEIYTGSLREERSGAVFSKSFSGLTSERINSRDLEKFQEPFQDLPSHLVLF